MAAKHGPNKLQAYLQIHQTVMERMLHNGFVLSDNLVFTPVHNALYLDGEILCQGGIRLDVSKEIAILEGVGADALVRTISYSYNAFLIGRGNILRYDSPHATHNQEHHVHRYDVLRGDTRGTLTFLEDEAGRPTLGEVITELERWYYEHYDDLLGM